MLRPAIAFAFALVLAGCLGDAPSSPGPPEAPDPGVFAAASPSFEEGAAIPERHTCDAENVSPPLVVSGIPANATTLALRMIDPDVPTPLAPVREFTHWLVWNIPVVNGTVVLPEGAIPDVAAQGTNDAGRAEYAGPCPPIGSPPHRYHFTFHAVAGAINLPEGATRAELEAALEDASLDTVTLTGTYARAIVG